MNSARRTGEVVVPGQGRQPERKAEKNAHLKVGMAALEGYATGALHDAGDGEGPHLEWEQGFQEVSSAAVQWGGGFDEVQSDDFTVFRNPDAVDQTEFGGVI